MENNHVVVKANQLIEAKYKLSVREQKIILFLVSKIKKEDDDFKMYTLPIKEFNQLLGNKGDPKYSEIKAITKGLMSKILEFKEGKTTKQMAWLSYVEYNENEGNVKLSFDPRLKPYLLQLKREFTSYKLKNVMELKSGNTIRLYELLKQYMKIGERHITVDDLKEFMGIGKGGYSKYTDFKRKVILTAQKEMDEKTDISFDFLEIKKGRKVDSIRFMIHSKDNLILLSENQSIEIQDDDWFESLYSQLNQTFKEHDYTLTKEIVKRWVRLANIIWGGNKYVEINKLTQQAFQAPSIENHIAFITYILNEKVKCVENGTSHQKITVEAYSKKIIREELVPEWLHASTTGNNERKEKKNVNKAILEEQKRELMERVKSLSKSTD